MANIKLEGIKNLLPRFLEALKGENIESVLDEDLHPILGDKYSYLSPDKLFTHCNMIVSFGGDGTILHTARLSAGVDIPIMGINLGKVGFLAEIPPEDIDTVPSRLRQGDYVIIDRMAFAAITASGNNYFALNDIVLDRNAGTRILNLSISINNEVAGEFFADGVIISTPTGSTAHSLSAGGPIVMPECNVILLTPICPHSLAIRPMIVNGACKVRIGINEGKARMAVDGQSFVDMPSGSEVTVQSSEKSVRIARFRDRTYFDILHTRLKWGVSLKMKNA